MAVSVATDYTFPLAAKVKEMLENPEAFLAAAAPAAAAEEKKEESEEEEESDDDMGFSLFD